MIAIETRQLAGGVVLHAFPEGKRAVPLPCVVFYHASPPPAWFIVILPLPWHRQDCG